MTRPVGKHPALAAPYAKRIEHLHLHPLAPSLMDSLERGNLTKRDFKELAEECQRIERGLEVDGLAKPARDKIMELVLARLGMWCHKRNREFSSFKFVAAVRGKRE